MTKSSAEFDPVKIYEREKAVIEKKLFSLLGKNNPRSLYAPCEFILRSGGKRVRALLVMLSAKAVGAKYSDVYNAAMSVEILHNFTLVHDDIMDNADKRRGKPTLHIKYDLSTAILAGDNLIAIAYLNLLKDAPDYSKNILKTFTKSVIEVCEGQSLDKEFENRKDVSLKEYTTMIKKKTAALAEMCCSLGAQIGGATQDELQILKNYGMNLGMAFQLQDDLLDIFGDEEEFGKKVGGDLIEGKKTYLFLKALEKAKGKDKAVLNRVIRNSGIEPSAVAEYKLLYEKLGTIEDTRKMVDFYTNKAINAAEKVRDKEARLMLLWLANSLLKRNK